MLGIYKGFSRIDQLELERLQDLSKMKRNPQKIILGAINASFGDKTIFTQLSKKEEKHNPKLLQRIYELIEEGDYEEVEDSYGQS